MYLTVKQRIKKSIKIPYIVKKRYSTRECNLSERKYSFELNSYLSMPHSFSKIWDLKILISYTVLSALNRKQTFEHTFMRHRKEKREINEIPAKEVICTPFPKFAFVHCLPSTFRCNIIPSSFFCIYFVQQQQQVSTTICYLYTHLWLPEV